MRIPGLLLAGIAVAIGSALAGAGAGSPSLYQSWLDGPGATGDWLGARAALADHGISPFATYTAEVWGNTTGGMEQGMVYTGLLQFGLNLDLEKAAGWKGASINTTWLWLSGEDASANLVGNLLTISNIAGFQTLRLFDLWFQQELFDGRLSVRAGQLNADAEMVISDYGATFINGTFGWPAFLYLNLPGGGPDYPMGTLGLRVAARPVKWFTLVSAAFQGNVFAENVNRHGFRWDLSAGNGYTFLNEAQLRWNHERDSQRLPGQLKAGAWFQTGALANALADSTGAGNYGFYFILDQMLYREPSPPLPSPSGKDAAAAPAPPSSNQGLGFFTRVAFEPQVSNAASFYIDTGVTYTGLLPSRNNDVAGVAFALVQLSSGGQQELAEAGYEGVGAEMVLETTYQAQITPWLSLQPDLQFVINPGANRSSPNALVLGARMAVTF